VGGGIHMTQREVDRANILIQVSQKKLSQVEAAGILGISIRHVQRLYAAFQREGVPILVSKQRGKPSNHQLPTMIKSRVLELITCTMYSGFGPTFMREKLEQLHGVKIGLETTRQLMMESGVWEAKKRKSPVVHQQRKRRARSGELVQIDGSPHAWFEDRGDPCTLIVFIDDATGQIYGKLCESETTEDYMIVTQEYLRKYGRPVAMYSDKHGIFRVNQPSCNKTECITQFARALQELEIKLIYAHSPQAKGRVERANAILQDRLVKEMRLAGINNIEEGNRFLKDYWEIHNKQFRKDPEDKVDAHRPLLPGQNLEKILSTKEYRKVSKNLEVQYKNTIYQIELKAHSTNICGVKIAIFEGVDGKLTMEYKGRELSFKEYGKQEYYGEEVDSKEIDRFLRGAKERIVPDNHPWKKQERTLSTRKIK
jgi:transposase